MWWIHARVHGWCRKAFKLKGFDQLLWSSHHLWAMEMPSMAPLNIISQYTIFCTKLYILSLSNPLCGPLGHLQHGPKMSWHGSWQNFISETSNSNHSGALLKEIRKINWIFVVHEWCPLKNLCEPRGNGFQSWTLGTFSTFKMKKCVLSRFFKKKNTWFSGSIVVPHYKNPHHERKICSLKNWPSVNTYLSNFISHSYRYINVLRQNLLKQFSRVARIWVRVGICSSSSGGGRGRGGSPIKRTKS